MDERFVHTESVRVTGAMMGSLSTPDPRGGQRDDGFQGGMVGGGSPVLRVRPDRGRAPSEGGRGAKRAPAGTSQEEPRGGLLRRDEAARRRVQRGRRHDP